MAKYKVGDKVTNGVNNYEIIKVTNTDYEIRALTGTIGAIYTEPHSIFDRYYSLLSKTQLKYKVGDQIRYNTGGEYEVIGYDVNVFNNKQTYILREMHYPVGGVANVIHEEDCDFVDNNSQLLHYLIPPGTSKQQTKFKIGNIVTNTRGSTLIITYVGNKLYDFKFLKCPNNPSQVGKISNERIEFADANWKLDVTYREYQIDIPKQTKECTCESRTIFLKGCQCGAVQKYKPKWS